MPWYWTDDLARTLIDAGRVEEQAVRDWLSAPVAIRRGDTNPEDVAGSLLEPEGEEGDEPSLPMAA